MAEVEVTLFINIVWATCQMFCICSTICMVSTKVCFRQPLGLEVTAAPFLNDLTVCILAADLVANGLGF